MRLALAILFFPMIALGTIVPSDRVITWQGNVGIPGGITNRTTVWTNMTLIDNTGVSDVSAPIQYALNNCPAGQVVLLPAGTYKLNSQLSITTSISLRGAGPTQTILSGNGTGSIIAIGGPVGTYLYYIGGAPLYTANITSGAVKGATSLVVSSATGITNGSLMNIDQLNPTFVNILGNEGYNGNGSRTTVATNTATWGGQSYGDRLLGQIVYVTNVSGTTIGFDPPLIWDFTNSPQVTAFQCFTTYAGLENLKLYANNSGYDYNVSMFTCAYCWTKNIESDYADGDHLVVDCGVRCEIRDSYFHDGYLHTAGAHDDAVKSRAHSSGILIENNIMRRMHDGVMYMWGGGGNVFAYNFITNNFDQNCTYCLFPDIDTCHGAHVMMCLFEGNVANNEEQSGVWGSASHNTFARNFISGANWSCPPYTGRGVEQTNSYTKNYAGIWLNNLAWNTLDYNLVGNVFGCSNFWKTINSSSYGWTFMVAGPYAADERCWDSCASAVWTLGYADLGETTGSGLVLNAQPLYTLINHGNWDIVNGSIQWSNNIADHVIPQSYYLASKPAFFGNLTWPPIDPTTATNDNTAQIMKVPAVYRYFNNSLPPSGSGATWSGFSGGLNTK